MSNRRIRLAATLSLVSGVALGWPVGGHGDVTVWKMGGSGLQWSQRDTAAIFIEFDESRNAIQPVYLTPDVSILTHLDNWSSLRSPRELGYEDGERPRAWRGGAGSVNPGDNASYLVDGDSLSSNTPGRPGDFYTIDLAVPVPATRFGFFAPPRGFRTDGTPKAEDVVRAFDITAAEQGNPEWLLSGRYLPIGTVVASVQENFDANVQVSIPRQYLRYVRYFRGLSSQDETFITSSGAQAREGDGSIGDFEVYGSGIPKRVKYVTHVLPLDGEVNAGRLFFSGTSFRMIDGQPVQIPGRDVSVNLTARIGTDDDPNVYHEFTNIGSERVVSRERYEGLSPRKTAGDLIQIGKPGVRASITYDQDNWSFWSRSFKESGQLLTLPGGSHMQLKVTLESESFDDYVRLDSLWIELSPLLAREVIGEVAPLDNLQPPSGLAEVDVGVMTDFVFDLKSSFDASTQRGFNAVQIRTGAASEFRELQMGEPLTTVSPEAWEQTEDGIEIFLPQAVTRANNVPVRIILGTSVYTFAQTFETEVFDRETDDLPQAVRAGDVSADISTNDLRVIAVESKADVISNMRISNSVFTPNNDGINDELEIRFDLVRIGGLVPARLKIYDLAGQRQVAIDLGDQGTGPQRVRWDGLDEGGNILPPGLYVVEIAVESESGTFRRMAPIGVAY